MRRRLNPLRRLDPRTPAPAPSADAPTPDAPVAWAQDETSIEQPRDQAGTSPDPSPEAYGASDTSETPFAELVDPEPETTVLPVIAEEGAPPPDASHPAANSPDEPETALFAPVPPAPSADPQESPAETRLVEIGDAPRDATASPPLEVLSVQPDGTVLPAPDPSAPVGVEPGTGPAEPGFRVRGRLRRRLRYLRRVRELGLRDLGGLVFDLHRFEREGEVLVAGKLAALTTVDLEVRQLEESLDDRRELVVLREPGLAACPRCAALHGTDANFCPNCGMPFSGGVPATGLGASTVGSIPPPPAIDPASVTAAHPRVQEHGPTSGPT